MAKASKSASTNARTSSKSNSCGARTNSRSSSSTKSSKNLANK